MSQGTLRIFPVWAVAYLLAKGWKPETVSATSQGETAVHFPLEAKEDLILIRRGMDEARDLRERGVSHGRDNAR